jgi:hypothetical protein
LDSSVGISADNEDDGDETGHAVKNAATAKKELLARIEAIPPACQKLTDVDASLGALFEQHFGLIALVEKRWGVSVFRRFFLQVRPCSSGRSL